LRQRINQTLRRWGPYLFVWIGNIVWLAYFYTIGSYDSYAGEVVKEPLSTLGVFSALADAFWKAGFYVWGQIVVLITDTITAPSTLLTIGLIFVSFHLLFFYFTRLDLPNTTARTFAVSALLTGAVGILLGRIPSFAAGLPLTLQSSFDRFMISMMLGGSLFITGLVEFTIGNIRVKTVIFAVLIALGIGQQFFNANIFRRDWEKQQEILWQLKWRAPGLKPNTVLITDELPLDYETDLSFTAPINWMYISKYKDLNLPYGIIFSKIRLGRSIPAFEQSIPITIGMRGATFYGNTSQAVVIYVPKNGCLRILDPTLGDQSTYANLSPYLADAIPLSDPNLIMVDANDTMGIPFLSEPKHTWCYYYTKAELARQKNDWDQIISLMNEATALGYEPTDPFEWLPYIEAQAVTGDFNTAETMSVDLSEQDKKINKGLCQVWKRIQVQALAGSAKEFQVHSILSRLACGL